MANLVLIPIIGRVATLVVIAILATACSSTAVLDSSNGDVSADREPALVSYFEEWSTAADGGGVALVRDDSGSDIVLAAGRDPQTKTTLTVNDRVRVGSISKVFVAAMMLQLVDEGLVDLDVGVSAYVDDLDIANDVTIRELLGHRTGIPNYTNSKGFFTVVMASPDRAPSPQDLISYTNGESDFEPGTQFNYSNTNFIIAGLVIEAVDGTTLEDALERRVSAPLGLVDTGFDDGSMPDVAGGYSGLTPTGNSFDQPYTSIANGAWAAGSLVTTVAELATFLEAAIRGDMLSEESRAAMMNGIESADSYGLGLAAGSNFGVGHGGSIVGFNSAADIDPTTGEIIIVVVNNDMRNPDVPSAGLAEILFGAAG